MKRWFRRLGKIFLGLCLFWTLVHLIEDWRGKRAWEAWQRDQVAKGAIYDPAALVSTPIPDEDNFAKAPVVQRLFAEPGADVFPKGAPFEMPKDATAYRPNWTTGHVLNLKPWIEANHSEDLLKALSSAEPALSELAEATRRSGVRFDISREPGDDPLFDGVPPTRRVARVINLRALLALRDGKSAAALQDVLTGLRLSRQIAREPGVTLQLLQLAVSGITMQAIWEGLQSHAWNDAQLASLQEELFRQDELTPFLTWGRDERIGTNRFWLNLSVHPWWDRARSFGDNLGSVAGSAVIPRGWFYRNMLAADEHLAETWLVTVNPGAHRMYPDKVEAIPAWWNQHRSTPYTFFAKDISSIAGSAIVPQARRFADRQVALDEAFVVCALERYRLARKAYPDSLDSLMPAYAAKLPCDVFTGAPLHYRRDGDGFLLYSVGWDGKDEGGVMAMDGKDRDLSKGDWPWPQAAR